MGRHTAPCAVLRVLCHMCCVCCVCAVSICLSMSQHITRRLACHLCAKTPSCLGELTARVPLSLPFSGGVANTEIASSKPHLAPHVAAADSLPAAACQPLSPRRASAAPAGGDVEPMLLGSPRGSGSSPAAAASQAPSGAAAPTPSACANPHTCPPAPARTTPHQQAQICRLTLDRLGVQHIRV